MYMEVAIRQICDFKYFYFFQKKVMDQCASNQLAPDPISTSKGTAHV